MADRSDDTNNSSSSSNSNGGGDDTVQKPKGSEEEEEKKMREEEDKSFHLDLLSKVWSYRANGGMVAFWFVLLTMGGVGVIYVASKRWSWFDHSVVFVLVSFVLLYLWLLATGRTVLRRRSVEESAAAVPVRLLWFCGATAVTSAILLAVGEAGIRHLAEGRRNAFSRVVDCLAPVLLVLGVFNLVLARRCRPRLLVLVVMLSNAFFTCFCFSLGVAFSSNLLPSTYFSSPLSVFSDAEDFPTQWLQQMGPEDAFPLTSLANWNYLRTLPLNLAYLLPMACTFALFGSLVAFSKKKEEEGEDGAERTRLPCKSGRVRATYLAAAALGVAALLLGLAYCKIISDLSSVLLVTRVNRQCAEVLMLTMLGLALLFLGSCQQASGWARVAMLVAAGAVFVFTYNLFYNVDIISGRADVEHLQMLNSSCQELRQDKRGGRPFGTRSGGSSWQGSGWASEGTTTTMTTMMTTTTTTMTTPAPEQACFLRNRQTAPSETDSSVVCLPKSSLCDGRVDLAEKVQLCLPSAHGGEGTWRAFYMKHVFIDELLCPEQNGVPGMVGAIRGLKWTSMAICLAVMAVVALGSWKVQGEEQGAGQGEEMGVWASFQGKIFARLKEEDEERGGGGGEDRVAIIKPSSSLSWSASDVV